MSLSRGGITLKRSPAPCRRSITARLLLAILVIVAVVAAMPALHAASGLEAPDALDHGVFNSTNLTVGKILAFASLAGLFALGMRPSVTPVRILPGTEARLRSTHAPAHRIARRLRMARRSGATSDDEPASSAYISIDGDSTTLRIGHVP